MTHQRTPEEGRQREAARAGAVRAAGRAGRHTSQPHFPSALFRFQLPLRKVEAT